LLTEAIRRDILAEPEIRQVVSAFAKSPVSESLPNEFLTSLSSDDRVTKLKERYSQSIGDFLSLQAVPDAQINPDIRHAWPLSKIADKIETIETGYGKDTPEFWKRLQECIDDGDFLYGITAQERLMIVQRYRFARDVKLLALGAEVLDQKNNLSTC